MANYYEHSVRLVSDPRKVGTGGGWDERDRKFVCVALEGVRINRHLAEDTVAANWMALNKKCARELLKLLCMQMTGWDGDPKKEPMKTIRKHIREWENK
jgi:hypothetical protein